MIRNLLVLRTVQPYEFSLLAYLDILIQKPPKEIVMSGWYNNSTKRLIKISCLSQVIQWMQNPTELTSLRDFQEWKEKCDVKGQPYCSLPNACPLTTRELPGETLRLFTCMECPNNYPWILDPTGDGFSTK
jgi:hypothetical protein